MAGAMDVACAMAIERIVTAVLVTAVEDLADAGHFFADGGEFGERYLDQITIVVDALLAAFGNAVELFRAADFDFGLAGLFEIGERRIDDARAWHIEAAGALFEGLDQFIAVARLLGEQSEDDQLQVGRIELAAGAKPATEHAALEASHEVSPVLAARFTASTMS